MEARLYVFVKAMATGQLLDPEMHKAQMPEIFTEVPGKNIKAGSGLGLTQFGCWIGHSGAIGGYMANMTYCLDKDVAIISFFNKFSVLDVKANAADLGKYTNCFKEMIITLLPETIGVGEVLDQD